MTIQDEWNGRDVVETFSDDMATARLRRGHERGSGLAGEMTVEALPTVYRGTTFRSALEASWAATLDSFGTTWEYEPERVTLPSGARYIPDFHLPEIGIWLEVKGTGVPRVEKAFEFGESLACDCPTIRNIRRCTCRWPGGELVLIGNPPIPFNPWVHDEYDHWPSRSKLRLSRRHGGHTSWKSTHGLRTWLTRCTACGRVTWFDSARCRACRGPLAGAHGHCSGSMESPFTFVLISGPAAPADSEETETP